jgi:rhodanese-related sulfurtransferase
VLDRVLETGEPVEIVCATGTLVIERARRSRRAKTTRAAKGNPNLVVGDPDELIHFDWSRYWARTPTAQSCAESPTPNPDEWDRWRASPERSGYADSVDVKVQAELSPDELQACLVGRTPPLVIDVRETVEYRAGTVPGARNLPFQALDFAAVVAAAPPGGIVFICTFGHRSGSACVEARRVGAKACRFLAGGVSAWSAAGFAMTVPSPTSK